VPSRGPQLRRAAAALALALAGGLAGAHGDVTKQAVNTTGLRRLGDAWRAENPFRLDDAAARIGASAYNQNCARCHGLEAISGGIARSAQDRQRVRDAEGFRVGCGWRGAGPVPNRKPHAKGGPGGRGNLEQSIRFVRMDKATRGPQHLRLRQWNPARG
jgi:hypothetical protein